MDKIKKKYIIMFLIMLTLLFYFILKKNKTFEMIREKGYSISVFEGTDLDHYKSVKLKSDNASLTFYFFNSLERVMFEYCDKENEYCYIENYDKLFSESYVKNQECMEYIDYNSNSPVINKGLQCKVFEKNIILKNLQNELTTFNTTIKELGEMLYEAVK